MLIKVTPPPVPTLNAATTKRRKHQCENTKRRLQVQAGRPALAEYVAEKVAVRWEI